LDVVHDGGDALAARLYPVGGERHDLGRASACAERLLGDAPECLVFPDGPSQRLRLGLSWSEHRGPVKFYR
jgi:hypothetical protein